LPLLPLLEKILKKQVFDAHMMYGRLGNFYVLLLDRSPCHDTPHLPIDHNSVKLIKEKTIK